MDTFYSTIENAISESSGRKFRIRDRFPIGGGCINQAEKLVGESDCYFLKTNEASFLSRFEEEVDSLNELGGSTALRVPSPVGAGAHQGKSYLVLEYIESGASSKAGWKALGQGLAALHQEAKPYFGWRRDNAIGATPQKNRAREDWIDFFREQRLGFQFELAREKGLELPGSDELLDAIPRFFQSYRPTPSLLHGDLWSGNVSFDIRGQPFVFDPCCYYGDRETDVAFTEFFGGFPREFHAAYEKAYPLDSGYSKRKTLYNLYHCLNHYNLFGPPYDSQAASMVAALLNWR